MNIKIRHEQLADQELIYKLISNCFESGDEEKLVRLLHTDHQNLISLVAELDNQIIGQIILSKMSQDGIPNIDIYGLAPMCVSPNYQNLGIGAKLVEQVIQEAKKCNIDAIFVLGHPNYYPRFGFKPATEYNVKCEYDVPADVFMVLDLSGKLKKLHGKTVYYAEEFKEIF
ncbi:GNAT family N-acetyltransferase [Allofrancisella frigidaquae]|uniref:N-acetyltransferase n=1 Tax=Allofrancisella frigidaquae TaxID=1085644 RepID=A0A6M3HSH9_9GAMM|nr:N-acetyltransferase [Allofrancisella frigidaquae]KEI34628.1 acetyltransferase [Francisella sp. W12-1067]QIV94204.1 N-acetyltransferase [Allofrancisella frigidaquae]